jgi:hypothetical protein
MMITALLTRPSISLAIGGGVTAGLGIGAGIAAARRDAGSPAALAQLVAGGAIVGAALVVANAVASHGAAPVVRYAVDGAEQVSRRVAFRDGSLPVRNGWALASGAGVGVAATANA